jgi:tRNA(fMet)-specific endonuclease VapC
MDAAGNGAGMKDAFLLDTNHVGFAIRPISPLRDRLRRAYRQGSRLATCFPVLCELEAGIQQTSDPKACRSRLRELLKLVRIWPFDVQIAQAYGELFHELKRLGRVLSQVDMMLCAMARSMKVIVLTTDGDFDALPQIRTENWVKLA